MKIKKERAAVPYSCLIDNIKVLLIFLVVFNHIIAFNLVKVDTVVRYVWYAITIFHMPAFVTNTTKWPLFCSPKVNISLLFTEDLQYWDIPG